MSEKNFDEIEKTKKIKFRNVEYLVNFPNVGQFLDIEAMKQAYSDNRYGIMASSGVKSMYFALDLIDAISFITVMLPKIKRMFSEDILTNLQIDEAKELVDFYKDEISNWYLITCQKIYSFSDGTGEVKKSNKKTNK